MCAKYSTVCATCCCEEEMQGEMTPLSTCHLSTVSPDDTAARTVVPTHETHTIYVYQHAHTVVHAGYAHTHERHALYGRVGMHCSLPTMLVVLQRGLQVGKCDTQYNIHVNIQCIYASTHFSTHTCNHTPCLLAAHDGMARDDILYCILPHQPATHFHPRIMDFIAIACTPITFNYKITLLNYEPSRIHGYDKQYISRSLTMHAARRE